MLIFDYVFDQYMYILNNGVNKILVVQAIEMGYVTLVLNILAVMLYRNLISGFVYFVFAQRRSQLVFLFDLNALCCEEALRISLSFCSHVFLHSFVKCSIENSV